MSNSNIEGDKEQRILIVDDEIEIQKMLKRMLKKTSYDAATASDGIAALEELSHQDYDLAIIDLNMPKMDGETLISKIREDNNQISIMVLTGHGNLEKGVTLLKKYQISNFLQKPLEGPTHFLFSLESIFEKRRTDFLIQEHAEILVKKNLALEQEILQRKAVEKKLEKSHAQLEKRVEARTMTLQSTNRQLELEVEKSEQLVLQLEDRQLQNRRIVKEQTELICQLELSKREAEKALIFIVQEQGFFQNNELERRGSKKKPVRLKVIS